MFESAYLIGVKFPNTTREECENSLTELKNLTQTSDAKVVGQTFQDLKTSHPATFLGKGKISELAQTLRSHKANLVIIDTELSPAQNKNLQEALKIKVVDRTGLILDIFAKHAKTKEGKMQVSLAQCLYTLPRLVGMWEHFSRQQGGIGVRGPGETQLEVDRRRIREKMAHIRKELQQIKRTRAVHRSQRESVPIPLVSIVGYTNAGKSTLLNTLTQAGVLVEDKLFATLDPTVRRYRLPSGRKILLADTVGFISRLPHELVEAFKSTFEEVSRATLLLHLIDVSTPNWSKQAKVVRLVLREMDLHRKRSLNIYSKVDLAPEFKAKNGILISSLNHQGLDELVQAIDDALSTRERVYQFQVPYDAMQVLPMLYECGRVLERKDQKDGMQFKVSLNTKFRKIIESQIGRKIKKIDVILNLSG